MDPTRRLKRRIAIVTTRDFNEQAGRPAILAQIVQTLGSQYDVELLRLRSVMELRRLFDFLDAAFAWILSLLRGRPLPLQCVLYAAPSECAAIARQIRKLDCDAIYLDTVRCQILLRRLRKKAPGLHIITDFDDLMSRRASYLLRANLPFAPGHVARHFPPWTRYLLETLLARPVVAYEAATLPAAEGEVVGSSDGTILLSPVDCGMLQNRLPAPAAAKIRSILPAVHVQRAPWQERAPLRFVFIGGDHQLQNRTAIDFLVRTWQLLDPATPLHIFGRQTRAPTHHRTIRWEGFAPDLAEVYQPGSIALVPALDRGGIKTKVLEAWAWGCPVLGNPAAFEGLDIAPYPLLLPEADWPGLLAQPGSYSALWVEAARTGNDFVRQILTPEKFDLAWNQMMQPQRRGAEILDLMPAAPMIEPPLRQRRAGP